MKITILVENQASRVNNKICSSEWGFSAFLETDKGKILFDTGHSDIYWENAQNLKLNLNSVDSLALSHRHWDHVEGLLHHQFDSKKKVILHPDLLKTAPEKVVAVLKNDFEIIETKEPKEIIEDVYFLGQVPRRSSFETGMVKDEHIWDDSALVIKTNNGAVVLTGCSHSGITNICEYAKEITGQKLYSVIGGFHLFENEPDAVAGAIEYFKNEKVPYLYPMHCLDLPTLAKFYNEFGIEKLGAGDVVEFE